MLHIITNCAVCMQDEKEFTLDIDTAIVNDSGIYDVNCRKGHSSKVILQNEKYDILFELGVCAIADGYYRESIVNSTSSLEEFRKSVFFGLMNENGVELHKAQKIWKQFKNRSEIHYGLFLSAFLQSLSVVPSVLRDEKIALRNRTVHQGYIPTIEEATDYCKEIASLIHSYKTIIKEKYPLIFEDIARKHIIELNEAIGNIPRSSLSMPTVLTDTIADSDKLSVESSIEKYKNENENIKNTKSAFNWISKGLLQVPRHKDK